MSGVAFMTKYSGHENLLYCTNNFIVVIDDDDVIKVVRFENS